MIKSFIYLAGFVMAPLDGKQLLTDVLDRYIHADGLEIEYTIETGNGRSAEKCAYYTNGHDYYSVTSDRVSLRNNHYFIVVSKSRRDIMITEVNSRNSKEKPEQFTAMKDKLADSQVSIIRGKDYTGIKLKDNKALINEVLYEISDQTHTLKKVQYTQALKGGKPNTTCIQYHKTIFDRRFDRDFFSEKKILKKNGKGFEVANEEFKGFTIIDLTK